MNEYQKWLGSYRERQLKRQMRGRITTLEAQVAKLLEACEAVQFVLEKYDTGDEWEAGQTVATAIANVKGE